MSGWALEERFNLPLRNLDDLQSHLADTPHAGETMTLNHGVGTLFHNDIDTFNADKDIPKNPSGGKQTVVVCVERLGDGPSLIKDENGAFQLNEGDVLIMDSALASFEFQCEGDATHIVLRTFYEHDPSLQVICLRLFLCNQY